MSEILRQMMPSGLHFDWLGNTSAAEAHLHLIFSRDFACPKCYNPDNAEAYSDEPMAYMYRVVSQNGVTQYRLCCPHCHHNMGNHYVRIPNFSVQLIVQLLRNAEGCDLDKLPLLKDNRDRDVTCSVKNCESVEVELHHWAPTHIFGRASDDWPQGYLCRYHHNQWHELTKTGLYATKKRNGDST